MEGNKRQLDWNCLRQIHKESRWCISLYPLGWLCCSCPVFAALTFILTFDLSQPPFDPNQPPPPCPPWNSHEGMWNEQREPGNWSGGPPREGGSWSGPGGSDPGPPSWNSFDQQPPWGNQPDQAPWSHREPPFPPRMQVCVGLLYLFVCFHFFWLFRGSCFSNPNIPQYGSLLCCAGNLGWEYLWRAAMQ